MATYTVSTSKNINDVNSGNIADYDRFTITEGATLTINTDTIIIERLVCTTLGKVLVTNPSTTTPIFVRTGENSASGSAQLRFEGGGIFEAQGEWIEVGISDGSPNQEFILPQNALSESFPDGAVPSLFTFPVGATEPLIFNGAASLVDSFGDEKLGTLFVHDAVNNKVIFGDGAEGYIPPSGTSIRIPSIAFIDATSGTGYTDWDIATSGTLIFDKVSIGSNYGPNFGGGSSASLKNFSIGLGREDCSFSATSSVKVANFGYLGQDNAHLINMSGLNNPEFDNVFVYNIVTGNQHHGLYPINGAGGYIHGCRVVAPNVAVNTARGGIFCTSAGLDIKDYYYAGQAVPVIMSAGGSNAVIKDVGANAVGKRNPTGVSPYALTSNNSANVLIERYNSYPATVAEGLVAFNTYFLSMSTGTANYTVNDCEAYAGFSGEIARTNQPIFSNGANHRVNDFRVRGVPENDSVNHSTASVGTEVRNMRLLNAESVGTDLEWTDGCFYDFVYTNDQLDTAPATSGADVGTFNLVRGNTDTGYLYKPMGSHSAGNGLFNEVSVNGSYFFNNAGSMYMDTAGDSVEFIGNVHGGILDFTDFTLAGSGTSNFSVEFALRVPNGTWTAYQAISAANLSTALAALPGYDPDVGLQTRFLVTRTASNLTNYLSSIRLHTQIDTSYVSPFEVFPTKAVFSGVTVGDSIYVEDSSGTQKLFTVTSTTDDVELSLPNASEGEIWTYVIKRVGYIHQKGSFEVVPGTDVGIAVGMTEKLQAVGGSMYTGSNVASIDVEFDLVTPQMSIDVSQSQTSPQNVFDMVERALVTNAGMQWLAQQGTDTEFQNLGGAGSFLFHKNNIRLRRNQPTDTNAEVLAFVFSTDGIAVDESNGSVAVFSGTLVKDVWEGIVDDYDDVQGSFGAAIASLLSFAQATDLKIDNLNDFDPVNDTVARVALVDETIANADMRGTDGANTVEPNNVAITEVWQIHGLDSSAPMTVTKTSRNAGAIQQEIIGDEDTQATVTRL